MSTTAGNGRFVRSPLFVLSVIFCLFSAAAGLGWLEGFDAWALRLSRTVTSFALDGASQLLSVMGSASVTALLLAVLLVWLAIQPGRRGLAGRLLVAFVVATVVELALKFSLPQAPVPDAISRSTGEPVVSFETPYPYPSGHMLRSVILYGTIALLSRGAVIRAICVLLIVAMAASRVYLGVHWASDIIGGALLGMAALIWTFRRGGKVWRSR